MTNKDILVSVITPTLNSGRFIENCIESVKKQTENVEHIVVDGDSSDDTLEVLKRYPDIKSISEPDNGMYDAINKGIKIANGEIDNFKNLKGYGWKNFKKMKLWRQDKGHRAEVKAFVGAVKRNGPSPIPFKDIIEVTEACLHVANG